MLGSLSWWRDTLCLDQIASSRNATVLTSDKLFAVVAPRLSTVQDTVFHWALKHLSIASMAIMGSPVFEEPHISVNPWSGKGSIYINQHWLPIEKLYQTIPRSTVEGALFLVYLACATAFITCLVLTMLTIRNIRHVGWHTLVHALFMSATMLYLVDRIGLDTIHGAYLDPEKLAWDIYLEHFDSISMVCNQAYVVFAFIATTSFKRWLAQFVADSACFSLMAALSQGRTFCNYRQAFIKAFTLFSSVVLTAVALHYPNETQDIVRASFTATQTVPSEIFHWSRENYQVFSSTIHTIGYGNVQQLRASFVDAALHVPKSVLLALGTTALFVCMGAVRCTLSIATSVSRRLHDHKKPVQLDEYRMYEEAVFKPMPIHTADHSDHSTPSKSPVVEQSNNIESSETSKEEKIIVKDETNNESPLAEKASLSTSKDPATAFPSLIHGEVFESNNLELSSDSATTIAAPIQTDTMETGNISAVYAEMVFPNELCTKQVPEQEEAKPVASPPALEVRYHDQETAQEPEIQNTKPVVSSSTEPEGKRESLSWSEEEEEDLEYFNILPTFAGSSTTSTPTMEVEVIDKTTSDDQNSEGSADGVSNAHEHASAVSSKAEQDVVALDSPDTPLVPSDADSDSDRSEATKTSCGQSNTGSEQTGGSAGPSGEGSNPLWSRKIPVNESGSDNRQDLSSTTRNPVRTLSRRSYCRDFESGICKGQDSVCRLSHYNPENPGPCRDYAYGTCKLESNKCLYDHTDDESANEWVRQTCDAFARGKCHYGGLCEKIHERVHRPNRVTPPCKSAAMMGQCRNGATCIFSHDEDALDWRRRQCVWSTRYECKFNEKCLDMHEMIYTGPSSEALRQHRRAKPSYTWTDNRWAVSHPQPIERAEHSSHHHETKAAKNAHDIWVSKQLKRADRTINNPNRPRRKVNLNSLANVQALVSQTGSGVSRPICR